MKKNFLTLVFAVWVSALFSQTLSIQPTNSKIQYAGRMSFADVNAPEFSMPGTSVAIAFTGTGLDVNLTSSGTSYIYVIVNGNDNPYEREVIEVSGPNNSVSVASNLPNGNHSVKIAKLNEYDTKISFLGATIHGSAILDAPARAPYKIEFYGDSNPSGWSAWDVRDEGHANLSGGYHTYPGITARMLNAEYSNFAAGGWGTTSKTRKMDFNDAYNRIHIGDRTTTINSWDFANNYWNFSPDVIVINLGANDYYNGATKANIIDGWNQLVTSIRQHCPQSHIVMANSYGWAIEEPADYVHEFVQLRHDAGDIEVSYVKFPWLWSDYHAVINEHAGFANILADHIASVMGWATPTPSPLSSFGKDGNVGNGSFESSLISGFADGWRPFATWSYPEYVTDEAVAYDGSSFIRCPDTYGVMHANDASAGEAFNLSVWAKAVQGAQARLKYEFRNQGQSVITANMVDVTLGSEWEQISLTTDAAPDGTWQINVILEAIDGSTIDFDLAVMSKADVGNVPVTGVTLLQSSVNLLINETIQLSESVEPVNASDKSISWGSSNTNIATVNANGLVTALAEGTALVTVTTNDGGYSTTCSVNVSAGNTTGTMQVVNIVEGIQSAAGPNSKATAKVFIEDNYGNPVADANITGTFSGDFNESVSGVTGADGSVVLVSWSKKKGSINVDFCVDNITHSSLAYDEASNLITCTGTTKSKGANIQNQDSEFIAQVYPNPVSKGQFNIMLNGRDNTYTLDIYNALGQLEETLKTQGNHETKVDVTGLNKGVYYLVVRDRFVKKAYKFIIQ